MKNIFVAIVIFCSFSSGDKLLAAAPNIGAKLSTPISEGVKEQLQNLQQNPFDACGAVYRKLNSLNTCPSGESCIHFPVKLTTQLDHCVISMGSANEEPTDEVAGVLAGIYNLRPLSGDLMQEVFWSNQNRMVFRYDVLDLQEFNRFNHFILGYGENPESGDNVAVIVFDRIDYPAANIAGILDTKSPSNSDVLALSRLPTRVETAINAAQPAAPIGDPNSIPPPDNSVASNEEPEEQIDPVTSSEMASSGTGSCTLYPHLPVTGWWSGVGGFIILIVMMMLTRRLARSKSRRQR